MLQKKYHSSIRINESEKEFLELNEISVLRAVRIGIMSLKYAAQSDSPRPCIYLARTGKNQAPPADPCDNVETPAAHCCLSCPVRKAMPKRIPAALQPGQNENDDMIEQDRPSEVGSINRI